MPVTIVIHILAGSLGLLFGYIALYTTKGAVAHRRSGTAFVYAMSVMASTGILMSIGHTWQVVNVPAGMLTFYLVWTGLATLRAPAGPRGPALAAMLVAFAVGLFELALGLQALASGGRLHGIPAFPFLLFAVIGLFSGVGDLRLLRAGGIQGAPRLARHLWRMSLALLIAAMSFFLGQADELPKAVRIPALLALPVLAVLVTLLYWVWRVRIRRAFLGSVRLGRPEAV